MKSPITGKEMIIVHEETSVNYMRTEVPYFQSIYMCTDTNTTYTDTALDTINLRRMEEAYKKLEEDKQDETEGMVFAVYFILCILIAGLLIYLGIW